MSHPYNKARHGNDPKWLGGLGKYRESDRKADSGDTNEVIRNYDADPAETRKASYVPSKKGK